LKQNHRLNKAKKYLRIANDNSDFPVLTAEELELFFRGEAILDLLHCSSLEAKDSFHREKLMVLTIGSKTLVICYIAMEAMAHLVREFSH